MFNTYNKCAASLVLLLTGSVILTGCSGKTDEATGAPKADTTIQAPIGPGANKAQDTAKPQVAPGPGQMSGGGASRTDDGK